MVGKELTLVPCTEVGCKKPIHVDVVDENEVNKVNPDYVEADNWLHDQRQTDHPKIVPDHHIFLSDMLFSDPLKVKKTLAHELAEVFAESLGMGYDKAHEEVANPVESEVAKEAGNG
jgi:hypothetical protein